MVRLGWPEFLHQRHVLDAAHLLQHLLDGLALLLQRVQIGAEDLDGQRAFQAGFRFVHGVLGRLGVVEDDAGKGLELLVDGLDQRRLGAIRAGPLRIGFQADVEFDVEKAGRIGAVVGPASSEATVVTSGKERRCRGSCGVILADSSKEMV
jgi:hypothetical protein